MKLWKQVRTAVVTIAFTTSMVFGAMQSTASARSSGPGEAPELEAPSGSCSAKACRAECGSFGGDLVPGGPGQPLVCACCG